MSIFSQVVHLLQDSKSLFVTTHVFPDADGLGSALALLYALDRIGKEVVMVIDQPLAPRYRFLDPHKRILSSSEWKKKYPSLHSKMFDVGLLMDTHVPTMVGKNVHSFLGRCKKLVCIDHHPESASGVDIPLIDTTAAATAEIVGEILEVLKCPLDLLAAKALYCGLLIDTSSFRYPTVTEKTHKLAACLVAAGVSPGLTYDELYSTKTLTHLQLLGDVLQKTQLSHNLRLAWMGVRQRQLKKYNISVEDTRFFINNLLTLRSPLVVALFTEGNKSVRLSLRSHGSFDVSSLAARLGGGGHRHSAACEIPGSFAKVVKETVPLLESWIAKTLRASKKKTLKEDGP